MWSTPKRQSRQARKLGVNDWYRWHIKLRHQNLTSPTHLTKPNPQRSLGFRCRSSSPPCRNSKCTHPCFTAIRFGHLPMVCCIQNQCTLWRQWNYLQHNHTLRTWCCMCSIPLLESDRSTQPGHLQCTCWQRSSNFRHCIWRRTVHFRKIQLLVLPRIEPREYRLLPEEVHQNQWHSWHYIFPLVAVCHLAECSLGIAIH